MSELDLLQDAEHDTADGALELSIDLSEESFLDDHVITLTPSAALMAARALALYSSYLEQFPAPIIWGGGLD